MITQQKRKNSIFQQQGFTLVELLAVMIVLITVGGLIFGVLYASLRGSNRATILTDVQENGDYVLTEMGRVIRFAQAVEDPASCIPGPTPSPTTFTSITIRNADQTRITYSCDDATDTIASNGASLLDTQKVELTACSFTCSQNSVYETPTIGISFSLNKRDATSAIDNNAPLTFQTTVTLRNKIQ